MTNIQNKMVTSEKKLAISQYQECMFLHVNSVNLDLAGSLKRTNSQRIRADVGAGLKLRAGGLTSL